MSEPTTAQVIAEFNVAMKNRLADFTTAEKPLRTAFELARKPLYDVYRADIQAIFLAKEAAVAKIKEKKND